MTYQEATDYLFTQLPMFQNIGAGAYKPGLDTVKSLLAYFGNPHLRLKCIHIAGTNGKGSTAHSLAAVLQQAGHKVGLFTSPHLLDFRERIRIDGRMIDEEIVTQWLERYLASGLGLTPSFFELTTAMAFTAFADAKVDYAVIECGLGGRLDSTNVITPLMSIITNISLDHTSLLGDTPPAIAAEKAGIIKPHVPIVIGEADDPEVLKVFQEKADECHAPLTVARPCWSSAYDSDEGIVYTDTPWGDIVGELTGECQRRNMATILTALSILSSSVRITPEAVRSGLASVNEITGLMGRWMIVSHNPEVICDTGHNPGGWAYIAPRLAGMAPRLTIVLGFAADKDIATILQMLPKNADYIFTQASTRRALSVDRLLALAREVGLDGEACPDVATAFERAKNRGNRVFVGGSTFVVADMLEHLNNDNAL